jgi:hypothetical protein
MRSLFAALLLAATPALAAEVAGVKVPESIVVDGMALQLNGAGIRTRTVFKVKVYVGALYVPSKSSDAAAIVALDQPKAVRLTLLRGVDRKSMLDALQEGFERNSASQLAELLPKLKLLEPSLPDEAKEGQVVPVTYVPGTGITFGVEGGKTVTVAGKDFADAMFRVWLGPKPVDDDLKEAMLGK